MTGKSAHPTASTSSQSLARWLVMQHRSHCVRTSLIQCLCTLLIVVAAALTRAAEPPPFDLVIRGGQIVDGTGNPWSRGDLAIEGNRIVSVGTRLPAGSGRREIDARGLVVAPGFIDMHSHSMFLGGSVGNVK